MAARTWVFTDLTEGKHVAETVLPSADLPRGVSVEKRVWHGGRSEGVEEIRINNGRLQFSVLPTRGMGLWKAWCDGVTLGWKSPVPGPVHPHFVPLGEPSGLGWLSGFDEWICRCGLLSNGAPDFNDQGQLLYPLHGHVANLPAHFVEVAVDEDRIVVRGTVTESRFHFQKLQLQTEIITRLNQPGLEIRDQVTNLSASEGEMQMLYHCNFGSPLLEPGAEVLVPAERVVPRNDWAAEGIGHWSTFTEPTAGMPERVYLVKPKSQDQGRTLALLKSAKAHRGVSLHWNTESLACFTLWKNETAQNDGYVTGLEPGTNFPNPRSFETEHQRVVTLPGGGHHAMSVEFQFHGDAASVAKQEETIRSIQGNEPPELSNRPLPEWCAS